MKLIGTNAETILKGLFTFTMTACAAGSIVLLWGTSEAAHLDPSALRPPLQVSASSNQR
jgi:hypothetical protein